jgi:hypothetical protein
MAGAEKIPTIFWVTQQMTHPLCWNGVILGGIVLPGTNSNPQLKCIQQRKYY